MYKFLARRIHDGYMTLADVPEKFKDRVKAAYKELYGIDLPEGSDND